MFKLYLACLLVILGVSLVVSQEVTPDDEDFSDGGILDNFLTQLEEQSGLGSLSPDYTVYDINCPDVTECTVNPNGTVIWDVREQLYSEHMMQKYEKQEDSVLKLTLDGCLNFTEDVTSYRNCMTQVRQKMITFLDNDFNNRFRTELEKDDCKLASENCVS